MSEREHPETGDEWPRTEVHCRRLDRLVPAEDHVGCLYCFGTLADVGTGEHEAFCDFRPGKDPIHFGFPVEGERESRG